jgi:hypothetical protein
MQVHARELFRFVDNLRTRTGLNKISDYPRMWRVCVHFKRATRLRPWTVRGRGLFPDSARLFRGKLAERCQDVTRIVALATPWTILCPPGELLRGLQRQLAERFLAVVPTAARTFTGVARNVFRQQLGHCAAVGPDTTRDAARTFRDSLPYLRVRGWCLTKITGFPISESRRSFCLIERSQLTH